MLHRIHCGIGIFVVAGLLAISIRGNSASDEKLDAKRDLIVFVGKKLSVVEKPAEENSLDGKFQARFRILKRVFGRYDEPEITFTVYDHYGEPGFADYDTALMFVSRYEGKLYHEKYQFFPVYPTANGRWASCGDAVQWEIGYEHKCPLKPVPITFAGHVTEKTTGQQCTEGNYVEDLFALRRDGVLKARGWIF